MPEFERDQNAPTKRLVKSYRDLELYRRCFRFQQSIFKLTTRFPAEEKYSLTDQVRRSSRSVGANVAEAWSKRRYVAHFLSKLTDADGELQETMHWLRTAYACKYLIKADCEALAAECRELGRMLGAMIANHHRFCPTPPRDKD
ncbi:MAG: four helix bundle protein [Verrucomicrobium sp.]